MEIISRLNALTSRLNTLEEKLGNVSKLASKQKGENDETSHENVLLKEKVAQLEGKLNEAEKNTAQYISEQNILIERVENMLKTCEMLENMIKKQENA